jgi:hypothetical protein
MQITFTDVEIAFADSHDGRRAVARAKQRHSMQHAYLGDCAPAWTDAMEAEAIRAGAVTHNRGKVLAAAATADSARQTPIARARRDGAQVAYKMRMADAYKGGR